MYGMYVCMHVYTNGLLAGGLEESDTHLVYHLNVDEKNWRVLSNWMCARMCVHVFI
jgi:hypothetical protein